MQGTAEWIAVQHGAGGLRVWIMGADDMPLAELHSDAAEGAEQALIALAAPYLGAARRVPAICAGMATAPEAPPVRVPCAPPLITAPRASADPRLMLHLLPSVAQSSPPDIMQADHIAIAGLLRGQPDFDGVLCLPGAHTRWVRISAGEIVSFQTYLTGALFGLLSRASVLAAATGGAGWDEPAFLAAVEEAMARPQAFSAKLFGIHAGAVLEGAGQGAGDGADDGTVGGAGRARLSGLLVGLELAGAKPYWLGQHVAIAGEGPLARCYRAGLCAQGVAPGKAPAPRDLARAGLATAQAARP